MKQVLFSIAITLFFLEAVFYTCSQWSTLETETLHQHVVQIDGGSAVVVADGWVLTAKHVVDGWPADRERYEHPDRDVALVKWDTSGKTAPELAPQSPGVGSRVFLVGFAMSRTEVVSGGFSGIFTGDSIEGSHTCEAAPGTSGSGIFNDSLQLVGVHLGFYYANFHVSPPEQRYLRIEAFSEWLETLLVFGV